MTLQVGTFSVTIPAGSFKLNLVGRFASKGVINGVSLDVQIVPLGNNLFTFKAACAGVDVTGITNPVTVVPLYSAFSNSIPESQRQTIGTNTGTTTVLARF